MLAVNWNILSSSRETLLCWLAVIAACSAVAAAPPADKLAPEDEAFFESKIRPLLVDNCYGCHSEGEQREGGLLLDRRSGLLRGGDSGPAVVVGKPEQSLLILAVKHDENVSAMPPDGKLTPEQVKLLELWVRMGLPDPRGGAVADVTDPAEHWAFQLPSPPTLPAVDSASVDWARGPLDLLMLKPLLAAGLTPSEQASDRTLLRRLSYDLTGLPPTPEMWVQLEEGLTEQEYRRLVDQLLAGPQFGERWGRYWLDLSRYADTKGYVFQEDRAYPKAHLFRDWVIRSLNQDLPYDAFLKRQLAADQLFPDDPDQLAAMGFLTLGRRFLNNIHDIIDDRIDVTMRGTQGLTVGCARCHDHKYDPIAMREYYSLYSVFWSSEEPQDDLPRRLVDRDRPRDVREFKRGSPGNRGEVAPRGYLQILNDGEPMRFGNGSGRLELAEAIASEDNPLTARVFVNRVWGRLMGRHLVDTPSDFGVRTAPPPQVDALDYLSLQLMRHGWSLKSLVREIVLSATYRQSSRPRPDAEAQDPENLLWWRMNRRRLDLEAMRDSLLAVTGQLNGSQVGGKSENILQAPARRRTVYAHIDRQNLPSLFRVFDFASPDTHNPKRPRTTVPQQSLFLLNSPLVIGLSEQFAATTESLQPEARLERIFRTLYGRLPSDEERVWCRQMIADATQLMTQQQTDGWDYGYGTVNDRGVVAEFKPLPVFAERRWQGGAKLPDPQLGWVSLTATGGHPGSQWMAIRRWVAPADWEEATVAIRGALTHSSDQGDGVRGRIILQRQHERVKAAEGIANNGKQLIQCEWRVRGGDVIDFVVDGKENVNHDSFQWEVDLRADAPGRRRWNSREDFRGERFRPLDPWAQLVQLMLISNELMFVD